MALHLSAKAAKDGAGTTITGGVQMNDESGAGTGPFDLAHVLIDSAQAEVLGVVTASPAANTVLGRLKDLLSLIVLGAGANVIGGVTIADGSATTIGAKADAKSASTDATAITAMSVWKQVSASVQAIATSVAGTLTVATHAVTGSGNFASTVADGSNVTLGAKADAKSTATDATAITAMQVWKQISASVQSLVTAIGSTAWDLGSGTGGSRTQRTILDSASPGIITTGTQAAPSSAYLSVVGAGDVPAAASDTGNPVKIGGLANSATPTKVTAAQRVAAWFGLRGEQVCVGATRENKGKQKTSLSATTSETTIVTAVASTFLDLYGLILANTGATTTKVDIRDTTGGSIIATIEVPTLETRGFMVPVDSAVPQATVNTNWTAQCASATTAMEVTALYVKNT